MIVARYTKQVIGVEKRVKEISTNFMGVADKFH
jgi:hypothetical protein